MSAPVPGTARDGPGDAGAPRLTVPDGAGRDDLAGFVGRVVRLEPSAAVRLRADGERVVAWAPTPFDVLVSVAVTGEARPADLTVPGHALLAALAVVRGVTVDPGSTDGTRWLTELPPPDSAAGWRAAGEVTDGELSRLAEQAIELANAHGLGTGHGHGRSDVLDRPLHTVAGSRQRLPVRCLLALSGMGLIGGATDDVVPVRATDSWLRLDTRHGAVLLRRHAMLPLLV